MRPTAFRRAAALTIALMLSLTPAFAANWVPPWLSRNAPHCRFGTVYVARVHRCLPLPSKGGSTQFHF
jgi:hypothetical protein